MAKIISGSGSINFPANSSLNMESQLITNLLTPSASSDAATKYYVDTNGGGGLIPSEWTLSSIYKQIPTDFTGLYYPGDGHWVLKGPGTVFGGVNEYRTSIQQSITGDFTLTCRILSMYFSNSSSTAGASIQVFANDSPSAVSPITYHNSIYYAALGVPPSTIDVSAEKLYRTSEGAGWAGSVVVNSLSLPLWLRIERTGNDFQSYYSSNGSSWTEIGTANAVTMSDPIYVGISVFQNNSADGVIPIIGVFDNVSLT